MRSWLASHLTKATLYLAPCILFIFKDEILSLLALTVMGLMCLGGILAERSRV